MKHCDKCGVYYKALHDCDDTVEKRPEVAETPPVQPDMVNSPPHYRAGGVECIDAIRAALGHDGFIAYCLGNVQKYTWRHKHKGGQQDLQKALFYMKFVVGQDPRAEASK